ncbi:hypothetical protein CPAV1605_770 [seawater metagenome]|uniref:Uncharacterized protein n=1 Tax=seawater metagenome TaxID=1561972 RepID=A0A5E8CLL6_9ZZZZ
MVKKKKTGLIAATLYTGYKYKYQKNTKDRQGCESNQSQPGPYDPAKVKYIAYDGSSKLECEHQEEDGVYPFGGQIIVIEEYIPFQNLKYPQLDNKVLPGYEYLPEYTSYYIYKGFKAMKDGYVHEMNTVTELYNQNSTIKHLYDIQASSHNGNNSARILWDFTLRDVLIPSSHSNLLLNQEYNHLHITYNNNAYVIANNTGNGKISTTKTFQHKEGVLIFDIISTSVDNAEKIVIQIDNKNHTRTVSLWKKIN